MFLKFFRRKPEIVDRAEDAMSSHGIDREMFYCPSCGDEYRPGVGECAACRVPLITGEEQFARVFAVKGDSASRSMEISPEDDLVSIRKGSLYDMKHLRRVLAAQRIPALIVGDDPQCGRGCCGPELFLQIKRTDLDPVQKVLAEDFVRSTALDSHDLTSAEVVFDHQAAETTCPACGCRFSPTVGACPDCGLSFE